MHIPLVDEKREKYKVERIKPGNPNIQDTAVEVEDEDTMETQLKFKSDGLIVPKPGADKINTTKQTSLIAKLKGNKYSETIRFIDYGDGSGDFVEIDFDNGKAEASGEDRMFDTHRSLMSQKYSSLFEEKDNTQLWIAAYLSILAVATVGGMWFVTTGIEDTVAQAVSKGIEAGLSSAQNTASGSGAVGG